MRIFAKLGLAGLVLVLLLAILEASAVAWLEHRASPEAFRRYATVDALHEREGEQRFTRHWFCGWIPTPSWTSESDRHDARGYRGHDVETPKPPGELRIACMGASTTYGITMADWREAYPARLEDELHALGASHARVVNAGVPGWTSWEVLAGYAYRVADLEPDLLVVYLGLNDVNARMVWPPSEYTPDARAFRTVSTQIVWPSLWEHSTLARMLLIRAGRLTSHADLERAYSDYGPTYQGGHFRLQQLAGNYPAEFFRETPAARILAENPPVYLRRNLEHLLALARVRGTRVAFVTFVTDPSERGDARARSPEYQAALAESNAVLAELAEREGAYLLDLASAMEPRTHYFTDGVHMSVEGNALRGRWIAEELVARGLVGERLAAGER